MHYSKMLVERSKNERACILANHPIVQVVVVVTDELLRLRERLPFCNGFCNT